jgi:hypothetical protein
VLENVEVPEAEPADLSIVLERGESLSGSVDQGVEIAAGDNALDIHPVSSTTGFRVHEVRGRVLDARGAPVANAGVTTGEALAATAADGSFVLFLGDGEYALLAQVDGASPGWTEEAVVVDGAPVAGVEIRLGSLGDGAALSGHLLGLEPAELAWATVRISKGDFAFAGAVAADGSFRIGSLGPGAWDVDARSGDRQVQETFVLKPGDREVTGDLRFTPRAILTEAPDEDTIVVTGVEVDGGPVAGLEIRLSAPPEGEP